MPRYIIGVINPRTKTMNYNDLYTAYMEAHYAYEDACYDVDHLYHLEYVDGKEISLASLFIREQACKVLKAHVADLKARLAEFQ
jgi:hypothetical protein